MQMQEIHFYSRSAGFSDKAASHDRQQKPEVVAAVVQYPFRQAAQWTGALEPRARHGDCRPARLPDSGATRNCTKSRRPVSPAVRGFPQDFYRDWASSRVPGPVAGGRVHLAIKVAVVSRPVPLTHIGHLPTCFFKRSVQRHDTAR